MPKRMRKGPQLKSPEQANLAMVNREKAGTGVRI